jgi:hypothetical protein
MTGGVAEEPVVLFIVSGVDFFLISTLLAGDSYPATTPRITVLADKFFRLPVSLAN